jgi:histidinol-phosphate aminotransferase
MITRRDFGKRAALLFAGASALSEFALAQRASSGIAKAPPGTIWLNANEWPDGPCGAACEAMARVLPESGRYHYPELPAIYAEIARSEGFDPPQVIVGAGSSEVLQIAVQAFSSPTRPLIVSEPTFELPLAFAKALGHASATVPLTGNYAADVKRMAAEAAQAGGGLIYLCNPNNPTSSITPKADIAWLVSHLPAATVLLLDEAYIHFSQSPELESGFTWVRQNKDVIVTRTFSKIYGMAGLRIGFGCARPELIANMAKFRTNVVSIVGARAALASLKQAASLVPLRRAQLIARRNALCGWLQEKKLPYIEPHANFVMIDVGGDVGAVVPKFLERGVAVGRPFPPLNRMLRVSIGAEQEMAKFRSVFTEVVTGHA